jgi:hypothetical protein
VVAIHRRTGRGGRLGGAGGGMDSHEW